MRRTLTVGALLLLFYITVAHAEVLWETTISPNWSNINPFSNDQVVEITIHGDFTNLNPEAFHFYQDDVELPYILKKTLPLQSIYLVKVEKYQVPIRVTYESNNTHHPYNIFSIKVLAKMKDGPGYPETTGIAFDKKGNIYFVNAYTAYKFNIFTNNVENNALTPIDIVKCDDVNEAQFDVVSYKSPFFITLDDGNILYITLGIKVYYKKGSNFFYISGFCYDKNKSHFFSSPVFYRYALPQVVDIVNDYWENNFEYNLIVKKFRIQMCSNYYYNENVTIHCKDIHRTIPSGAVYVSQWFGIASYIGQGYYFLYNPAKIISQQGTWISLRYSTFPKPINYFDDIEELYKKILFKENEYFQCGSSTCSRIWHSGIEIIDGNVYKKRKPCLFIDAEKKICLSKTSTNNRMFIAEINNDKIADFLVLFQAEEDEFNLDANIYKDPVLKNNQYGVALSPESTLLFGKFIADLAVISYSFNRNVYLFSIYDLADKINYYPTPEINYTKPRYTSDLFEINVLSGITLTKIYLYKDDALFKAWTVPAFEEFNYSDYLDVGEYKLVVYASGSKVVEDYWAVGYPPMATYIESAQPKDGETVRQEANTIRVDVNIVFRNTVPTQVALYEVYPDGSLKLVRDLGCFQQAGRHTLLYTLDLPPNKTWRISFLSDYDGCTFYGQETAKISFATMYGKPLVGQWAKTEGSTERGISALEWVIRMLYKIFEIGALWWMIVAFYGATLLAQRKEDRYLVFVVLYMLGVGIGVVDLWLGLIVILGLFAYGLYAGITPGIFLQRSQTVAETGLREWKHNLREGINRWMPKR